MRDVFRGTAQWWMIIVECVFYGGFCGIWMAESIGEVFSGFEGEACGFLASNSVSRIVWLGFVIKDMAQMAA